MKKDNEFTKKVNETDTEIQASSSTDLTGLIPALPETEAELEAYEDLYPFMTPAKNKSE